MPISLLDTLLGDWKKLLTDWAGSGTLTRAASEALLLKAEPEPLKKLVGQWSHGDFSGLPPIVLLPTSSMPGAAGAYAISTGSIYLNQEWLAGASAAQVIAVLTEELGHHLDWLLNVVDTPGDEGEYFSDFLRGDELTDSQKEGLRAENDSGTIKVGNKILEVEYAIQAPNIQPIKQFSKAGDNFARKSSSDGTYIYVSSITSGVASLSKYDLVGGLIWERSLDQGGGWPSSSAVASDGSILVATGSDGLSGKVSTLARFSSAGNKIWEVNNSNQRYGQDIAIEGNTVYVSGGTGAGFSNSNIAFVNAYSLSTGSILWSKTYANSGSAFISDLEINNGRIYCSAALYGKVDFDIAIAGCLDLNGNEIWWRSAPAPDWNGISAIRVVDSQLIGTGYKADGGDRGDTRLISFNTSDGTILWDTSWGDNNQQGSGAIEVLNGKIYVAYGDGVPWNSSAIAGGYSAVTELDTAGNLLNIYTYDVLNSYDGASELVKVGDSLFLLGQATGTIAGQVNGEGYDIYLASVVKAVAPVVTLAVSPATVTENGPSILIYTFSRSGATTSALTVNYSIAGTADATDYTGATPGTTKTISFAAGSATATLTIDPTADSNIEADETVAITLSTGTGYTVGTATAVVGTITNDEAPVIRGNSIYTLVDGPSWTQAEANSVKLGGHLTAITSESENQFLVDNFAVNSPGYTGSISYYLGLTDKASKGNWAWSDGSMLGYTNWSPGEPQQTNGEDYSEFLLVPTGPRSPGQWGDNFETIASGKGIAEIPFIRRGDSAYVIVQGPTWEEAEANAVKLGGHLVTINDAAENQWIQSNFNSYISKTSGGADFWIGYTDKDQEGVWKWLDGSPSTYTNWAGTGPNNRIGSYPTYDTTYTSTQYWMGAQAPSDPAGEDYADINAVHGTWNDVAHNHRDASVGIAEIKLAPNNKPTGTPTLSGTFKAGQTISIDKSPFQDTDNFTGWTPTYAYVWEVSSNNGSTWTRLTSADAIDNNTTYSLASADVGKKIRGVVGYVDGYGSSESVESAASIGILVNNSAPTGVAFSAYAFNENIIAGSAIATLTGTDPDVGNTFAYSLVSGAGPTDNGAFSITGDQIKIKASPNFEVKPSYSIRVRTKDQGGLFFDKNITLTVNNVNEAPTAIITSAITFDENIAAGFTVANLSTTDPDVGNTFTYALVAGAGSTDNAAFTISGNQLNIKASPDFEAKSSYKVRVRTTDQGGLFREENLVLTVNNLVEKMSASVSTILAADKDTLELTGAKNLFGRGNQAANWIIGNLGKNKITGGLGKDILTGAGGVDTFFYGSLKESLLSGFDIITDYAAGEKISVGFDFEGDDLIASAGSINALGATQISTLLTSTEFLANTAEAFTVQNISGTFVALNDAVAGFQDGNDALIHLSNYTISASNPVSII